ncbi:biotin/lipoyl-binding protein [Lachnospiraceae bacterium MD1]|jgi:biotin carboxyl carrier protein|uniref:Biotin/lipoyl-binding protein n=1 Tax=Variimorphobacter saccharofermentans TaxID=2755051 RepID=A0A839K0R2_9FIRM|nr:biotin/lipoyl-containing protein [Variimorphobacter saccharofermentans]MBB2183017.1 biotin/lipoyl-binding protein [Variimorphobacter saccharofermentans]
MKYYTITVNGTTYDVSVEEGVRSPQAAAPVSPAPVAAPKPAAAPQEAPSAPAAAPAKPAASGSAGSVKVNSPMPGKILNIKASVGQAVKKGDVILILEAMKMENEIVAPQDGTVASIDVAAGQSVEAGNLLATLN